MSHPYRPANGTEGEAFEAQWCANCWRDAAFSYGDGDSCTIIADAMAFDVDDPEYPKQWIIEAGRPLCTAFESTQSDGTIHDARQEGLL